MNTGHELIIAEYIERTLTHARHQSHRSGDIGAISELHADVCYRGTERTHGKWHHIECAAGHRAGVQLDKFGSHFSGLAPVVRRTGVDFLRCADVRAVLDARDVGRV